MKNLSVEKIHKIIELAKLAYPPKLQSEIGNGVESLKQEIDDFRLNKNTPRTTLYKYIDKLSDEEKRDLTALMWLGRGHSGEKLKDFSILVEKAEGIKSEYIFSKAPLAQYLEDGLKKLSNN
jgi:hypothetical protein